MAHSSLATVSVPADPSNYTKGRQAKISSVTVHHMAGVLSAERCGQIFQTPGRNGSTHYGIGVNGEIGVYVEEENTAWANSNWASNNESVSIEFSNSATGGDWPVSDATLASGIKLIADIAKRNNLGTLVPGQNLTWHSFHAQTSCPGPYLLARIQYIADEANKINNGGDKPAPTPTPAPAEGGFKVGDKVTPKEYVDYNGTRLLKTRDYYYISAISGNRAVLAADSATGVIYAAMNTNNLNKVGSSAPAPAPAPSSEVKVGDKVTLTTWKDYNGIRLMQTRDFYYLSELNGDRAVLRADSMGGAVYAAVNKANLRKV